MSGRGRADSLASDTSNLPPKAAWGLFWCGGLLPLQRGWLGRGAPGCASDWLTRVGRGKIIPGVADKATLSHTWFSCSEPACRPSGVNSKSKAQREGGCVGARRPWGLRGAGCDPPHGCRLPRSWVNSALGPHPTWHVDASNAPLQPGRQRSPCWRNRPASTKRGPGDRGGLGPCSMAAARARIWPSFRDFCLASFAST